MLKQRVITALLLFALALWAIFFWPTWAFNALITLVFSLAAWEWARLGGVTQPSARVAYAAAHAGLFLLLDGLALQATLYLPLVSAAALGWVLISLWLWNSAAPSGMPPGPRPLRLLAGPLLLLPAWLVVLVLREGPAGVGDGGGLLLYALMIIWAADVGAYFVGRRFGRHKLAPQISPGKTWEGALGGLAAVLLLALIGLYWHGDDYAASVLLPASLCAGVVSIFGDLLESWFKRSAGVKDSSQLLPGHGGVLDRIDSVLAAAPMFAAGLIWFA